MNKEDANDLINNLLSLSKGIIDLGTFKEILLPNYMDMDGNGYFHFLTEYSFKEFCLRNMKLNKNEKFNKLIEETENLKNNKEKLEQIIIDLKDKFKLLTEKSEEKNLDNKGKIDEKIKQLQKEKKELERRVKKITDNLIKKRKNH